MKKKIAHNDTVDSLSKDYNLSERQRDMLSNYACKLHPKDYSYERK